MTKREEILDYFSANPEASNKDVAERFGVKREYVSTVKQRAGIARKNKNGRGLHCHYGVAIDHKADAWLKSEAERLNVSPTEVIRACLVDAMADAPTPHPASTQGGGDG